jgi:cell division protein FtsX
MYCTIPFSPLFARSPFGDVRLILSALGAGLRGAFLANNWWCVVQMAAIIFYQKNRIMKIHSHAICLKTDA